MWWDDISKIMRGCSLSLPYVSCPHGLFPVKLSSSKFASLREGFHKRKRKNKINFWFLNFKSIVFTAGLERILRGYKVMDRFSADQGQTMIHYPGLSGGRGR